MLGRFGHNPRALAVGNGVVFGLSLLRNVALARLLGPEQFGIAATLLLVILFFDALSEVGVDRYLMQSREGDEPLVQANVQAVMATRGAIQAALMVALAIPLSLLLRAPEAATAYMWLALVPLFEGLTHLDVKRIQRSGEFGREAVVLVVAELASLVVAIAAALITRDFYAALYGLIVRSATLCLTAHLLARRRYQLGWDRAIVRRLFQFGWPLLFSAIVILLSKQGDRAMVSALMGPYELGIYSAAAILTHGPVNVAFLTFSRLILVRMAQTQDDPAALDGHFERFMTLVLALSLACGIGFATLGQLVGGLLFGPEFARSATLFALLGFLQAARLFRVLPTGAAFALGNTRQMLNANLVRLIAVPLGLLGFLLAKSLIAIAFGFLLGEIIALVWAFVSYNWLRGHSAFRHARAVLLFILTLAGSFAILPMLTRGPLMPILLFVALSVVTAGALLIVRPRSLRDMPKLIRG